MSNDQCRRHLIATMNTSASISYIIELEDKLAALESVKETQQPVELPYDFRMERGVYVNREKYRCRSAEEVEPRQESAHPVAIPPIVFYDEGKKLVDLINSRKGESAYASNISDAAAALYKASMPERELSPEALDNLASFIGCWLYEQDYDDDIEPSWERLDAQTLSHWLTKGRGLITQMLPHFDIRRRGSDE